MLDQRTGQTDPSKLPSRTGIAFVLFIVVLAAAAGLAYFVYGKAHPQKAAMRETSRAQLEHGFFKLLVDVDQRVL